jgi:hypothetical protein
MDHDLKDCFLTTKNTKDAQRTQSNVNQLKIFATFVLPL